MKTYKHKIMKGTLETIILSELNRRPMHGYGLIVAIRKKYGVLLGPSTLYPLLNDLESRGHLRAEWNFSNPRPRKIYYLTPLGQKELIDAALFLETIAKEIRVQPTQTTAELEAQAQSHI